MKKLLLTALVCLCAVYTASFVHGESPDEELIIRAVATSYPEAGLGAKTAMCAVILKRIGTEGFGNSAAEVIRAEDSGFDPSLLSNDVDEKTRRIARDACMAAIAGADPTGGLLYFEKLPEAGLGENRVEFEKNMDLGKYGAVIGGFGFW